MLISIVTPNRNCATFIDKTLASVVNQTGCDFELIVIDGASTDNSMDVVGLYKERIAYALSEPDNGMYDAINKGIAKARGDVIAYLNSDDFYYPGTLNFVADFFESHPDVDLVYGDLNFVDADGRIKFRQSYPAFDLSRFQALNYASIGQPAAFWRRRLQEQVGSFDTTLKMASDFDFFVRAGRAGRLAHVSRVLAAFRVHGGSMTSRQIEVSVKEVREIHRRYLKPEERVLDLLRRHAANAHFKAINLVNWPRRLMTKLGGGK
jgi:glycosyltransferase involved in cell wall biosynthesis